MMFCGEDLLLTPRITYYFKFRLHKVHTGSWKNCTMFEECMATFKDDIPC